jgi:hypothetical protein
VIAVSVVAGLVAIGAPRAANAAAPELDAAGLLGCPSAGELRRAISAQLGRDDFDEPDAPRVSVRVRRGAGEALVAEVSVASGSAAPTTRTIEGGPSCGDLVRAAALSIALAIEADAVAPPAALPEPVDAAPPPPPPPSASPDERAGVSAPADLRRARVVLLASGLTSIGLLPSASAGGGGSARVRVAEGVWLSARGLFLPETRMPNDAFGMTLVAGGAGACVEPFGSNGVAAVGCAHVMAGSLAAVSPKLPLANGGAKPFGAATLSAGARARIAGPVTLEGAIEAAAPFAHPTFVTEVCPVSGFQQPFVALALVLGAGVTIP